MDETRNPYTPPSADIGITKIANSKGVATEHEVSVRKYVVRFAAIFLALLLVIGLVLGVLGLNSNSGATIGALMGAALYAVSKFLKDNGRLPTPSEKKRLVWLSFLALWLVSLVPIALVFLLMQDGQELWRNISAVNVPLMAGVAVFLSVFYLGFLSMAYGYMARKHYEALQKKGKI